MAWEEKEQNYGVAQAAWQSDCHFSEQQKLLNLGVYWSAQQESNL